MAREPVILHGLDDDRDAFACAWSAIQQFKLESLGRGAYGKKDAYDYQFGREGTDDEWTLWCWRDSAGIHVARDVSDDVEPGDAVDQVPTN